MALSTFDAFKHLDVPEGAVELSGEVLHELQSVLCMMLGDFDEVCRCVGANYTMGGGSCLGAVRHEGFIPWDDDLDVNMARADFELFAAQFDRLLGDRYVLQVPGITPGYELCFPRLRLKGTVFRTRDDFQSDECGVFIDIFLVENAPSSAVLRGLHGFVSMALGFCYSCRRFYERRQEYFALADGDKAIESTFRKKAAIGRFLSIVSLSQWIRAWDCWNGAVGNDETKFVVIPVGRKHYFGELYPRASYFPPSNGIFEGREVFLPADPDLYLRALYGSDYMTPPPERERERHIAFAFDLGDRDLS